jgi:hypothetical protein
MSATPLLRCAGVLIAVAALLEPSWTARRTAALPVQVRWNTADPADERLAAEVKERLARASGGELDLESWREPAAVILVGAGAGREPLPPGVPVSVVTPPRGPNASVVDVIAPPVARVGWMAAITTVISAESMEGTRSTISLEQDGIELGTIDHEWTGAAELFEARFTYLPAAAGAPELRVTVSPAVPEIRTDDNHADLRLSVQDRPWRVLVFEPRPSWLTGFLRRTLERSPLFDVASLVRVSRGVAVRAGSPPSRLTARMLGGFDAVAVGAPEELRDGELDALAEYARLRGGAVLWLPDRRPSGPFLRRLQAHAFARIDEVLLQTPAALRHAAAAMRASEFAIPLDLEPGVRPIALLDHQKPDLPAVVSWPEGAGRMIFSGALDAWRYRGENAFAAFWLAEIAGAAAAAPGRLEVEVEPAVTSPGRPVQIRARLRATEFDGGLSAQVPSIAARLIAPDGSTPVRLWASPEPGVFEGSVEAPGPGEYRLAVSAGKDLEAETPLLVSRSARPAAPARPMASAAGGVLVSADRLTPLESHLAGLARPAVPKRIYPTRSPWWTLSFVAILCAEWWIRKRRGLA